MLVHIIADYGYGDLAFAEVVQRLKRHLPDAEPLLTPVPPVRRWRRVFVWRSSVSMTHRPGRLSITLLHAIERPCAYGRGPLSSTVVSPAACARASACHGRVPHGHQRLGLAAHTV